MLKLIRKKTSICRNKCFDFVLCATVTQKINVICKFLYSHCALAFYFSRTSYKVTHKLMVAISRAQEITASDIWPNIWIATRHTFRNLSSSPPLSHFPTNITTPPFLSPQMPNQNPRRLSRSPPPTAMDPQVIIGTNTRKSDLICSMERDGLDPNMLDLGSNVVLHFVYDYLPNPPVSPAATLALSGTSWVPDSVDRISRLPDKVLRSIVSRLPAKDAARTAALASRWRPVWRSVPLTLVDSHLLPDYGAEGRYIIGAPSPRAVTAAVSRVLAAHPGPFRCVHLTCTTMDEHRGDRKSTRLNSSHSGESRMPSSA